VELFIGFVVLTGTTVYSAYLFDNSVSAELVQNRRRGPVWVGMITARTFVTLAAVTLM
jgi:hypothetical protein